MVPVTASPARVKALWWSATPISARCCFRSADPAKEKRQRRSAVGLFPTQISLILELLGGGEEVGVDLGGADRSADLPHGFAYGIQEGVARIFHKMPAVSDLGGIGKCVLNRHGIA